MSKTHIIIGVDPGKNTGMVALLAAYDETPSQFLNIYKVEVIRIPDEMNPRTDSDLYRMWEFFDTAAGLYTKPDRVSVVIEDIVRTGQLNKDKVTQIRAFERSMVYARKLSWDNRVTDIVVQQPTARKAARNLYEEAGVQVDNEYMVTTSPHLLDAFYHCLYYHYQKG